VPVTHPDASAGLRWIRRPGALGFTLGAVLAVVAGLPTLLLDQVAVGVMWILVTLDVVAAYSLVDGLLRLRSHSDQRDAVDAQGRGWWLCELPVVEHRYEHVRKAAGEPEQWRCRRCGKRRFTQPRSFGDTVSAGSTEGLWIRRDHDQ
jgi:hypothetical protein